MAFMATIDALPKLRQQSYTPGNTGGGTNPKPRRPPVVDPRPPAPPRKPQCLPRKIIYPSKVGYVDPGPRGKPRWRYWYRYPCRRTGARRRRRIIAVDNKPVQPSTRLPEIIPINDIDRNPTPIHKPKPGPPSRGAMPTIRDTRLRLEERFDDLDFRTL